MKELGEVLNRKFKPFNIEDFGGLKEDEYIKDEVIYCKKCNTNRLFVADGGTFRARCICKCQAEERDRERELAEREKRERELEKELADLKTASLIGERYKDVTFDNTEIGHNEMFTIAFNRCKRYCETVNEVLINGFGIYLYGDTGTGKSRLTACMANYLIRKRKHVLFTSFSQIAERIKQTFGNNTESEAEIIARLSTIDFLFIDDLGSERVQGHDGDLWMQEKIYEILNKRYNNKKPTIFTSNYSLSQLITERGLANRTVDRIAEMSSAIIEIKGKSYRLKARMEQKIPF